MTDVNLPVILFAAFLAAGSPGPATLAIAGTSMSSGRKTGLALASGVTTGSFIWSVSAAFGLGAVMAANAWVFEVIRYFGAGYLMWLAIKAARSAWAGNRLATKPLPPTTPRRAYTKGLALHLTNPKAVLLFWRSLRHRCTTRHAPKRAYYGDPGCWCAKPDHVSPLCGHLFLKTDDRRIYPCKTDLRGLLCAGIRGDCIQGFNCKSWLNIGIR